MDKIHIDDVDSDSYFGKIIKLTCPKTTMDEFKKILKTIDIDFIAPNKIYDISYPTVSSYDTKKIIKKEDGILKILFNRYRYSFFTYERMVAKMKIIFKLKDANLNIQDAKGNTILHIFAKNTYRYFDEYILCLFKSMILDFRFDLNIKNNQGITALNIVKKNLIINRASNIVKAIEDRMKIEKKAYLTVWCIKKQKLAPKDIQWMIWKKIFESIIVDF